MQPARQHVSINELQRSVHVNVTHGHDTALAAKFIIPKRMAYTLTNVTNVCTDTSFSRETIFIFPATTYGLRCHNVSYTQLFLHRNIFYIAEYKPRWTRMRMTSRQPQHA